MSKKVVFKITIDAIMTVLLVLLMGYMLIGEEFHEWIGLLTFILFLIHHILNMSWLKNIFKGKYTIQRRVNTLINILIFICMIGLMISSVILSKYVFSFLNIKIGMSFARTTHMICSYWGFALMSIHLGMHGNMILKIIKKYVVKRELHEFTQTIISIVIFVFCAYGIYSLFNLNILSYMFFQKTFVLFDFEATLIKFFSQYISIMFLFCTFGYFLIKIINCINSKGANKYESGKSNSR